MVARALAEFFPVEVHDGVVLEARLDGTVGLRTHSWLTPKNDGAGILIDPVPLGVLSGPVLVLRGNGYMHRRECSFPEHRGEEFLARVANTTQAMKATLESLRPLASR